MIAIKTRHLFFAVATLFSIFIGFLFYDRWVARPARERAEALQLSEVLTEAFLRASAIKAATLTGVVRADASDSRLFGLLNSEQRLIAPYSIDYLVELKGLGPSDYRWDNTTQQLTVRLPDVHVGKPNVDESRAYVVNRKGMFVTAEAMDNLRRKGSIGLREAVLVKASTPKYISKAREGARAAFTNLLRAPLTITGNRSIKIKVRFATEGSDAYELWDESTSIADVLADK